MSFSTAYADAFDVARCTAGSVPPPAVALWDVEDVAAQALAVLRLDTADVDADRVQQCAVVACSDVDAYVDKLVAAEPTPRMVQTAVARAVQLYRSKDAPFGVADAWSTDTVATEVGGAHVLDQAVPDKTRWGLA